MTDIDAKKYLQKMVWEGKTDEVIAMANLDLTQLKICMLRKNKLTLAQIANATNLKRVTVQKKCQKCPNHIKISVFK